MSRLRAAGLALLLGACGYSAGYGGGSRPRTVEVRVVDNRTFRQRIEIPLTRQILEQLSVYGGLRPAREGDADTALEVTLVDVQGANLVGAGQGFPVREGALEFAASARLTDLRTGAVLRDAKVIDRAEFRGPVGETESSAYAEGLADLARKIVLALEQDF